MDGRDVIVLDDEIARGSTVLELLARLRDRRVPSVRIACTHGLFCDGALGRIAAVPEVREIVCTNTVPVPAGPGARPGKLTVLSVASVLAEAIRRIHEGGVGQRPVRPRLSTPHRRRSPMLTHTKAERHAEAIVAGAEWFPGKP